MGYLAQVKQSRTDFHFYLIGDGPGRAALEGQIRELGLEGFVTLLGNQTNPFCYMDKMDGFVLTSRYEGQGMVIWEAKALGLPLYISKTWSPTTPASPAAATWYRPCWPPKSPRKRFTTTCQITTPKSPGAQTPCWGCDGRRGSEERQRYGPTRFTIK